MIDLSSFTSLFCNWILPSAGINEELHFEHKPGSAVEGSDFPYFCTILFSFTSGLGHCLSFLLLSEQISSQELLCQAYPTPKTQLWRR